MKSILILTGFLSLIQLNETDPAATISVAQENSLTEEVQPDYASRVPVTAHTEAEQSDAAGDENGDESYLFIAGDQVLTNKSAMLAGK